MAATAPDQGTGAAENVAAAYDQYYRQPNYFQYRGWLYRPFIRSLVKAAGLKKRARVLDIGCGQGFFTSLFAAAGMDALGADLSAEGVAQAKNFHGQSGAKFEVGDALRLPYKNAFDCVYTRSCSLYNRPDFAEQRAVTDVLLGYVRPGGLLIFDYYTNLGAKDHGKSSWRYHSLAEARRHFSAYPNSRVCFSVRVDTMVLGRFAFGLTPLNALASRMTGAGGELIAFIRK